MIADHTIEQLFHSLISGNSREARRVIEGVLAAGAGVDELIVETYRPIAAMIETLARARQLSERARDHATVLLQNLVDDVKAGTIRPDKASCEIETTTPRRRAGSAKAPASAHRRVLATHRRGTELRSPFTSMSFRDGVLRARLVGPQVNEREATIMRDEIERALDLVGPCLKAFILDLSEIEVMSSIALGTCVALRQRVDALEARALMTGVSARLGDLLSLLNLDRVYECAELAAA